MFVRRRAQNRYREKQKAKAAAAEGEFEGVAEELQRLRLENSALQVGGRGRPECWRGRGWMGGTQPCRRDHVWSLDCHLCSHNPLLSVAGRRCRSAAC